jgi:DNA primase large subunit
MSAFNYYMAQKYNEAIKREKERMKCTYKHTSPYATTRRKQMSPCIKAILENGAVQGVRNNTTVVLASSLIQNGMDIDEVTDTVLNWNSEKVSPRLPEREIRATIKSAFQGVNSGKRYGCRTIKELGLCVPEHCGISRK